MRKFLASFFVLAALFTGTAFAQGSLTLVGVGSAGAVPATIPVLNYENNYSGGTGTTKTVAGASFGATCTNRVIIGFVVQPVGGGASAATIGGIAATMDAGGYWFYAPVPTGTSGTITYTDNSGTSRLVVYRICDLNTLTPIAVQTSTASPGVITAMTSTTGGLAMFMAAGSGSSNIVFSGGPSALAGASFLVGGSVYTNTGVITSTGASASGTATYTGGAGFIVSAVSWY